jgi:hypothetical protein
MTNLGIKKVRMQGESRRKTQGQHTEYNSSIIASLFLFPFRSTAKAVVGAHFGKCVKFFVLIENGYMRGLSSRYDWVWPAVKVYTIVIDSTTPPRVLMVRMDRCEKKGREEDILWILIVRSPRDRALIYLMARE